MRSLRTGLLLLTLASVAAATKPVRPTRARDVGRPRNDTDAAIAGATRWPAVWLKREKDLGTLAPGRYADVISVHGDVLTHIDLLQNVDIVVQNGVRVR